MIVPNEIPFLLRPFDFLIKLRELRSAPIISFKVRKEIKKDKDNILSAFLKMMSPLQRAAFEKGAREKGLNNERPSETSSH